MTTVLFYDTETSGLPDWHAPSEAPQTPNLAEAYRHFFGRDPERQHSAAADMAACMQIWFAIADLQRDRGTAANEALVDGNYTPQPAA